MKKLNFLSLLIALYLIMLPVFGAGWRDSINSVQEAAERYRAYAVANGTSWAGTMYNGYHLERHRCAILGRMLGYEHSVAHLEELKYPPLDGSVDPHEILIFSISLENWVAAAQWALDVNEDSRKNRWNLDCVGRQGIPKNVASRSDKPDAEFWADGETLFVYGDIDFGFAKRFKRQLELSPNIRKIVLGSGGGSVRDAILSGKLIRDLGLETSLHGNCFSACPLVFMGGVKRTLWASPHRLGFHQVTNSSGQASSLSDPVYSIIGNYISEMGGDSATVLYWMRSARPSEMFEPNVAELCDPGVATFVQRVCGPGWNTHRDR
ncbi:hypothetical protein HW932_13350 [Allochromatium humboldtianum]|uniref:Uncharacterized protein n=1 Tax=Allochromatium humboldtianum TaxID=504901 RepID=A0A850RAB4_9GAMM|nr:hypothetical protein [Allochromatium humboldtianum]NVZ10248.1 hypothetical protein [Allochromatium humboldtianum]